MPSHDEKTCCMILDLIVKLNVGVIKNGVEQKIVSGEPDVKSVFCARLLDFVKAHAEEDVPKAIVPEPFNRSHMCLDTSSKLSLSSTFLNEPITEAAVQPPTTPASHLYQNFCPRFSKQVSSQCICGNSRKPITHKNSTSVGDSQASVPFSHLPAMLIEGPDSIRNKVYF